MSLLFWPLLRVWEQWESKIKLCGPDFEATLYFHWLLCIFYRKENTLRITATGMRVKRNWAPAKAAVIRIDPSDMWQPVTANQPLRHKKKYTQRQQKYPTQLTLRSSVTASWGAGIVGGRACCDWQGRWWAWMICPAEKGGKAQALSCLFFSKYLSSGF